MRSKETLLDTNLLVLLAVGETSVSLIRKHKNTRSIFGRAEYDLLTILLSDGPIVVVPHVAAEASNLLMQHSDPERSRVLGVFAAMLQRFLEAFVPSKSAALRDEYKWLGLTDAVLLEASSSRRILTTDAGLHVAAERLGIESVNFTYARQAAGLLD